jgi:hypothetical protein
VSKLLWLRRGEAISLALARSSQIGPEGFRWLRKAVHLKATELAGLFDVTPMQVV